MSKKKKSFELTEDSNVRLVGLHHHRFSRFLRFLKDTKAVIIFTDYDKESQEPVPLKYSSDSKQTRLTIENLISYSLQLSENQAREYTSRKLGLDDKHSDRDRVNGPGKIIESITVYLDSKKDTGIPANIFSMEHPFSLRNHLKKLETTIIDGLVDGPKQLEDYILYSKLKDFRLVTPKQLFTSPYRTKGFTITNFYSSFPFKNELFELAYYFDDLVNDSLSRQEVIEDFFNQVDSYYSSPITHERDMSTTYNFDPTNELIVPDHIDFKHPYNKKYSLEKFRNQFGDITCDDLNRNLSFKTLFRFRYEILWYLHHKKYSVRDWDLELQCLLIVTALTFKEIVSTIKIAVRDFVDQLRFELVTSEKDNNPNYQENSISLDKLSKILAQYMFPKGLNDTLKVNGNSILERKVVKYPNHQAAIGAFDHKTIYSHVENVLRSHLFDMIIEDLHLPKSLSFSDY